MKDRLKYHMLVPLGDHCLQKYRGLVDEASSHERFYGGHWNAMVLFPFLKTSYFHGGFFIRELQIWLECWRVLFLYNVDQ